MPNKSFVRNVLLCDDVRTEQSGKDIAIGIYAGHIVVPQIPFQMHLAVRFEFEFSGTVAKKFSVKLCDPSENTLFERDLPLELLDWSLPASMTAGLTGLIFPVAGRYKLLVRFDEDWEEQRTFVVAKVDQSKMKEQFEALQKRVMESLPNP